MPGSTSSLTRSDRFHEIAREARDYLARGASGFRSFRLLTCEEIENRSGYGPQFGLELLGVLANEPLVEHYRVVEEMQVGDIDL